jgi:hypothetical protein
VIIVRRLYAGWRGAADQVRRLLALAVILDGMHADRAKLAQMSEAARVTAQRFTPEKFLEAVRDEVQFVLRK